jgi:hypothetical protein
MVGLKDGVGAEVIPGGGLSRSKAGRVEGESHTEGGSDWWRVDGWFKSRGGPVLAEDGRGRTTEMPRNGLGTREPAQALVLALVLGARRRLSTTFRPTNRGAIF